MTYTERLLKDCTLCPRRCGVLRGAQRPGEGPGACRMGALPVVARAALHMWEEPPISGTNGSGTVFFSGCSLGCVFCQNHRISQEDFGRPVTVERLREICCDPRLVADNWDGGSAKLDACMELVTAAVEGGHRILLFSQFTSMLELLAKRLDEAGVSHFTLQGSTPKPVRAELVRRFNSGEADVFLISLRAGGTGLNLTAADIVIHYDPWWNVAAQNQATDRAYRIGQRNPVQVYKLIAQDTIEEKIVELQQAKQDLAETVTGSADGAILSMKPEELLQLLQEE